MLAAKHILHPISKENLAVKFTEIECIPITTAKRVCNDDDDDGGGKGDDDDTSTVNMVPCV